MQNKLSRLRMGDWQMLMLLLKSANLPLLIKMILQYSVWKFTWMRLWGLLHFLLLCDWKQRLKWLLCHVYDILWPNIWTRSQCQLRPYLPDLLGCTLPWVPWKLRLNIPNNWICTHHLTQESATLTGKYYLSKSVSLQVKTGWINVFQASTKNLMSARLPTSSCIINYNLMTDESFHCKVDWAKTLKSYQSSGNLSCLRSIHWLSRDAAFNIHEFQDLLDRFWDSSSSALKSIFSVYTCPCNYKL